MGDYLAINWLWKDDLYDIKFVVRVPGPCQSDSIQHAICRTHGDCTATILSCLLSCCLPDDNRYPLSGSGSFGWCQWLGHGQTERWGHHSPRNSGLVDCFITWMENATLTLYWPTRWIWSADCTWKYLTKLCDSPQCDSAGSSKSQLVLKICLDWPGPFHDSADGLILAADW